MRENSENFDSIFLQRVCPSCGKIFSCYPDVHGWRLPESENPQSGKPESLLFCSYVCMRKIERDRLEKSRIRYQRLMHEGAICNPDNGYIAKSATERT